MSYQEAIGLIEAEREAIQRMIMLALKKNETAGGDAQTQIYFIMRRRKVIEAMDKAIKTMKDLI